MANLYITKCFLELNGAEFTDFASFTEKAVEPGLAVKLMHKTGYGTKVKRFEFEAEYVVPQVNPIDFSTFNAGNATFTVEYDGGTRDDFGGVGVLSVGDAKTNGEDALTRAITFMAATKNGLTE